MCHAPLWGGREGDVKQTPHQIKTEVMSDRSPGRELGKLFVLTVINGQSCDPRSAGRLFIYISLLS